MHLKSLELNGFKSFASKVVLEFPKGITAIVGPNGSGKSNIIDSIRWILGEREAKNLRGDRIENLIFAGTPKKPRAAMAQAALHFATQTDTDIIGGMSEISVIRRAARDGVSQYFLNKSEVRLKDAIDFFAKSKLGTKGLTIINQGSSDLFVRANPEERRIMIEEILGLREFQIKKSDSERKLNNTNINLEKVKAIVEEVLPRLRMLKRQTAKWEKRAQAETELKNLEDGYFFFKFNELEKEKNKLEPALLELNKAIAEKNSELKVLENEVKKLEEKSEKGNFDSVKNQKNELLSRHLKIQKELSRLEAKAEILSQIGKNEENKLSKFNFDNSELINLITSVKDSLEKLVFEQPEKIIAAIKKIIEKINIFFALTTSDVVNIQNTDNRGLDADKRKIKEQELVDLNKIKNDLLKEAALIEEDLKQIEKTEAEIAASLQDFNKQFQGAFETMDAKRDEIRLLENKKQQLVFEREKIDIKFRDLEGQAEQMGRRINEFKLLTSQVNMEVNMENVHEIERQMLRLRGELASIGEIDQSLIKEAEETEKHYNFLSSQISDLEKASEDLKVLIKDLKDKIHNEFLGAFKSINEKFDHFFKLMFKGGSAKLKIKNQKSKIKNDDKNENDLNDEGKQEEQKEQEEKIGVEIDLNLPRKRIMSLEMLSGGEKSLVSIAALFALISVSPPPFLVLDEIDAALDEKNSKMFSDLIKDFSGNTQFIIVTHNRAVMEIADVLYGITMNDDGTSKILSLKLE